MYNKLAGMTVLPKLRRGNFFEIYKLEVVVVPTNKPMVRDDQDDAIYRTKERNTTQSLSR
jgi:preprotein translocase subunit SecA